MTKRRLVPAWTLAESDAPRGDQVWLVEQHPVPNIYPLKIRHRLTPVDPTMWRDPKGLRR